MSGTHSLDGIISHSRAWLIRSGASTSDTHPDTFRSVKVLYKQLLTSAELLQEMIGHSAMTPQLLIGKSDTQDHIHVEVLGSVTAARKAEAVLRENFPQANFIRIPLKPGDRGVLFSSMTGEQPMNLPVKRCTDDPEVGGTKRSCVSDVIFSREADDAKFGSIPGRRRVNAVANLGQLSSKSDRLWLTLRHMDYTSENNQSTVCIICLSAISSENVYCPPCCKREMCDPCLSMLAYTWNRNHPDYMMPCMACRTMRSSFKLLTTATESTVVRFRERYEQIVREVRNSQNNVNTSSSQNDASVRTLQQTNNS